VATPACRSVSSLQPTVLPQAVVALENRLTGDERKQMALSLILAALGCMLSCAEPR
jgi:hypothetical protein